MQTNFLGPYLSNKTRAACIIIIVVIPDDKYVNLKMTKMFPYFFVSQF